jgi:hypothetical protein
LSRARSASHNGNESLNLDSDGATSSRHKIPVLCSDSKPERERYRRSVRKYSLVEFEKGETPRKIIRRLLKVRGSSVVRRWVNDEYLLFLGVGPAAMTNAKIGSAIVGIAGGYATFLQLHEAYPKFLARLIPFALLAAILVAACGYALTRSCWRVLGASKRRRLLSRAGHSGTEGSAPEASEKSDSIKLLQR